MERNGIRNHDVLKKSAVEKEGMNLYQNNPQESSSTGCGPKRLCTVERPV